MVCGAPILQSAEFSLSPSSLCLFQLYLLKHEVFKLTVVSEDLKSAYSLMGLGARIMQPAGQG